jgi:hypothetical protein
MSIQVMSQERFIIRCIEEQARFLKEQEGEPYSLGIEFGITELVRLLMRELAQVRWGRETVVLERSLELAQERLNQWCTRNELSFDFTPYFPNVRKGLKYVAREISELSRQLSLSRQSERVAGRERITDGVAVPLEIVQVGLPNAIESLVAIPLSAEFKLDLEGIRKNYPFQGEWFPYQVSIEPFSLILDDDGTVLMSTLGLSEFLVGQARDTLLTLATQLYLP